MYRNHCKWGSLMSARILGIISQLQSNFTAEMGLTAFGNYPGSLLYTLHHLTDALI